MWRHMYKLPCLKKILQKHANTLQKLDLEDFVETLKIFFGQFFWATSSSWQKELKVPGLGAPNAPEKIKNTHTEDPKRDGKIVALDGQAADGCEVFEIELQITCAYVQIRCEGENTGKHTMHVREIETGGC